MSSGSFARVGCLVLGQHLHLIHFPFSQVHELLRASAWRIHPVLVLKMLNESNELFFWGVEICFLYEHFEVRKGPPLLSQLPDQVLAPKIEGLHIVFQGTEHCQCLGHSSDEADHGLERLRPCCSAGCILAAGCH